MILFRRAELTDLDDILQLAINSGVGMTTLPKDRELLHQRIIWACASFKKTITKPLHEYYLFVLEDTEKRRVIGTSAIESATGYYAPFYSYKISKRTRVCHSLNIRSEYEVLNLVNDNQGRSELCTLFLEPSYRVTGNGLLLSRARFLFMAQHPERFTPIIIAEMRGISDAKGRSPFWDSMGRYFFHMSFEEADRLSLSTNKQFIADLMPRNPVYVNLLPPKVQAILGKPHQSTVPAMAILEQEGFRYNNYMDIFDAGPTIEAPFNQIKTINESRTMTVKNISDNVASPRLLIANCKTDFRATISRAIFDPKKATCIICKNTANLLQVNQGDFVRLALLQSPPISPLSKELS